MGFINALGALTDRRDLTMVQTESVIGAFMDGTLSAARGAAVLSALATKGESGEEIVGAARAMRERSAHVEHRLPVVLDVCGTGGDGHHTINISTIAAFVIAAAGVPVAKHGNRAASSVCGSADVLEAAGLKIEMEPGDAARRIHESNFAFLYAPLYHPAMKHVAPIRRELGVRTIFNVLGPLTNPASATHQVVGVAHKAHLELVARALRELGVQAAAVVHARNGMDEVAGDVPTDVCSFDAHGEHRWAIDPRCYGVDTPLAALQASAAAENLEAFLSILQGERSPRADVVALNAGLALQVAGAAIDLREGFRLALDTLHSGAAYQLFIGSRDGFGDCAA